MQRGTREILLIFLGAGIAAVLGWIMWPYMPIQVWFGVLIVGAGVGGLITVQQLSRSKKAAMLALAGTTLALMCLASPSLSDTSEFTDPAFVQAARLVKALVEWAVPLMIAPLPAIIYFALVAQLRADGEQP